MRIYGFFWVLHGSLVQGSGCQVATKKVFINTGVPVGVMLSDLPHTFYPGGNTFTLKEKIKIEAMQLYS